MTKKKEEKKVSLLQTTRTKNAGTGKFTLPFFHSGKPQSPVKKIKVPKNFLVEDGTKISDVTDPYGDTRDANQAAGKAKATPAAAVAVAAVASHKVQPAPCNGPNAQKTNPAEAGSTESSIPGMSLNAGQNSVDFSVTKAFANGDAGPKPASGFLSLWPISTEPPPAACTAMPEPRRSDKVTNPVKNFSPRSPRSPKAPIRKMAQSPKKAPRSPKSPRRTALAASKVKTVDINKGLKFSSPAPMTMSRCQPQMTQEKAAPASKDYDKLQAQWLKETEEKKAAEARRILEAQFEDFNNENNHLVGNKKSLVKKILGKVLPKSSATKKVSAIEAAMAAAAAAVDAAAFKNTGGNGHPSEEEARALAQQALLASKQKNAKDAADQEPRLPGAVFHTYAVTDADRMASDNNVGSHVFSDFPISEVTVRRGDSISDLDASVKNPRKFPVAEIMMNNDTHRKHDDGSVSTLGVPRVFGQLVDHLLSDPRRGHQHPVTGPVTSELEGSDFGGSAPPPDMVTSHDAKALIDQLDSGTLLGDATAGTIDNEVYGCNIGNICFLPDEQPVVLTRETQRSDSRVETEYTEYSGSYESSFETGQSNEEPEPSSLNEAIDNAIRNHGKRISTNGAMPSSAVAESRQSTSPLASPHKSPTREAPVADHSPVQFDSFMNLAASMLQIADPNNSQSDGLASSGDDTEQHSLRSEPANANANANTPKIRGDNRRFFGSRSGDSVPFSDDQFDLLPSGQPAPEPNHPRSPVRTAAASKQAELERIERQQARKKLLMEQGRFLLEKDDEYWDTLSTIASTAKDEKSSDSDEYMDEVAPPSGPIPGEITTSSSDVQDPIPIDAEASYASLSQSQAHWDSEKQIQANLDEMMNDVTDLIDAELLDRLPSNYNHKASGPSRPRPEAMVGRPRNADQSYGGDFASAASHIAKKISWGFEEIFEDKNDHSESGYYTSASEGTSNFSSSFVREDQPNPELVRRQHFQRPPTRHTKTRTTPMETVEEEDLLTRTLEISKGLLETIMGSQVMKDKELRERQYDDDDDDGHDTESRDESNDRAGGETIGSPAIQNRLELLRLQRAEALAKFRQSQGGRPSPTLGGATKRDRDRLKHYTVSHGLGKTMTSGPRSGVGGRRVSRSMFDPALSEQSSQSGSVSDIDLNYTTSESSAGASDTPSQRARDLRMQIEDAMKASREIQVSNNALGNELSSFKQRYYNPVLTEI